MTNKILIVKNQEIAGKGETISIIVKIIKCYINDADVCGRGCDALRSMTATCKQIANNDYAKQILSFIYLFLLFILSFIFS